jgi:hypothetical protein
MLASGTAAPPATAPGGPVRGELNEPGAHADRAGDDGAKGGGGEEEEEAMAEGPGWWRPQAGAVARPRPPVGAGGGQLALLQLDLLSIVMVSS